MGRNPLDYKKEHRKANRTLEERDILIEENIRLWHGLSWRLAKQYAIDKNEILSITSVAFVQACHHWDKQQGALSTIVFRYMKQALYYQFMLNSTKWAVDYSMDAITDLHDPTCYKSMEEIYKRIDKVAREEYIIEHSGSLTASEKIVLMEYLKEGRAVEVARKVGRSRAFVNNVLRKIERKLFPLMIKDKEVLL